MVMVYNKDKEAAVYNMEAALRSYCHTELQLPEDWQNDELIAYLSFCSADGSSVANSICLPISVTEMPEDKVEIQTEFVKTIYRRILPDMETALQLHTTVHSLSAPPDKVQNYKCDT